MKNCPYCAEEIQDAANVCRFCNRDQPSAVAAGSPGADTVSVRWDRLLAIGAIGLFVVVLIVAVQMMPSSGQAEAPPLNLSAGKGLSSISITNREPYALAKCDVTLLERGRDDRWYAFIQTPLASMDTVTVSWAQFRHGTSGAQMPGYVGQNAKYFTVSCLDKDQERRSVGLGF